MSKKGKAPAGRMVALVRGINSGEAKRISMAELRVLVEDPGCGDVRTLLNGGNVIFAALRALAREGAARIVKGLVDRTGVSARVIVVTAAEFSAAVKENPVLEIGAY